MTTITQLEPQIQEASSQVKSTKRASPERHAEFDLKSPKKPSEEKTVEDQIVEELNKKHAVVHIDQFYVLTEKTHALYEGTDFSLESKQSFLNMYENRKVICSDGKTLKSKAQIWLAHPNRRQFENGITFDPTTGNHIEGSYNIWTGFAVKPVKGKCNLYKEHLRRVICSGNVEHFDYVWKWLARLVQKPNEIATGLVLMGKQGTGKGVFVQAIGKLFGKHFLHLDSVDRLVGHFNFHMKNAVLVYADEAIWGGNVKDVGRLKAMVTEKRALIESKGKDAITVANFRHFIFSSNEDWPIHLDPDDRRFLILPVADSHKENIPYFKSIDEELNNGGYEALLHELLNEDISKYDPRELPKNTEAFPVKLQSASSEVQYIYNALREGCFDLGNETPTQGWRREILIESIHSDYCIWCTKEGIKHSGSTKLGRAIHKLIPSVGTTKPTDQSTGKRRRTYQFPDLSKAKEEFQKEFKSGSEIWNL